MLAQGVIPIGASLCFLELKGFFCNPAELLKKEGGEKMSKQKNQVMVLTEIAISAALGLVFDVFFGWLQKTLYPGLLPYGGNIGLTMVPIMLLSFRRGIRAGLLAGLLVGLTQMLYDVQHILEIRQYLLDYPIAFMVVGFAGVISQGNKKLNPMTLGLGATLGGLLRYLSHFIAGVTFWRAYVPEEAFLGIKGFTPLTWSIFYNGLYMIPSTILSAVVLIIMFKTAAQLFYPDR